MTKLLTFIRAAAGLWLMAGALAGTGAVHAQNAISTTAESPRSLTGIRFRFQADGPVRGGFALAGSRLLFGTEAGTIYALDSKDGHALWRRGVGSPVLSTPAIIGSRAYFTTWDNALHALDLVRAAKCGGVTLARLWGPTTIGNIMSRRPSSRPGASMSGAAPADCSRSTRLRARVAWSTDLAERIRTTPAMTRDAVIVGTNAGHVIAVDRASGRPLWRFATEGAAHGFSFNDNDARSVVTAPIVEGNLVIAGGRDGEYLWHRLANGRGALARDP